MDLGLKNRVVLITGASQGMGYAIAEGFAEEDAAVVMSARREDVLASAAATIRKKTGAPVLHFSADIESESDVHNLVRFTLEKLEKIDVLVCNSGGPPSKYFSQINESEWEKYLNLNLRGFVRLARAVIPSMKEQEWGRVLFLSSVSAKQPIDGLILSSVARSGVVGLTKSLSNELAKYNILVNNVCPGYVRTGLVTEHIKTRAKQESCSTEQILDQYHNDIPLGRIADPKEIANVFTFLASENASYITGISLNVDGGYVKGVY